MPTTSAGLLVYRITPDGVEVLLVHPGGPFWKRKREGVWSIPKGEAAAGEDLLAVARRELHEETGAVAAGPAIPLGSVRQASGKVVHAWAVRGDFDTSRLRSNTFQLEWPPRSGKLQEFPEVDEAAWLGIAEARRLVLPAQASFLDRLLEAIRGQT